MRSKKWQVWVVVVLVQLLAAAGHAGFVEWLKKDKQAYREYLRKQGARTPNQFEEGPQDQEPVEEAPPVNNQPPAINESPSTPAPSVNMPEPVPPPDNTPPPVDILRPADPVTPPPAVPAVNNDDDGDQAGQATPPPVNVPPDPAETVTPTNQPAGHQPQAAFREVGISMVPYQLGLGDEDDDSAIRLVGETPNIQYNYLPRNGKAALEIVRKYSQTNKRIKFLMFVGHGSSERPYISFSQGELSPDDVDINFQRQQRDAWEKSLKRQREEGNDTTQPAARMKEHADRVEYLESISEGCAPGAVVLLINCYAAKGEAGIDFTRSLGQVFLGRHGGTVIASKSWAGIGRVKMWVVQQIGTWFTTGEWIQTRGHYIQGEWVKIDIPPRPEGDARVDPDTLDPVPVQ